MWVVLGQLPPPLYGGAGIARRFTLERQRFQRGRVAPGELSPLAVHPALELHVVDEEESIEQGTAVQRHRLCLLTAFHGGLECDHIARNDVRVQPQRVARDRERVIPQRLAKQVNAM